MPTPNSVVLLSVCNRHGDYAFCWWPISLSDFRKLLAENTVLHGCLKTERHYLFQSNITHQHIHFTWNIRQGKIRRSGVEGSRVFHCIWGSSVDYDRTGFLSISYYEKCSIPNIIESCKKHNIEHFFEDWTSDSDEESRKEPESDSDSDDLPDLV